MSNLWSPALLLVEPGDFGARVHASWMADLPIPQVADAYFQHQVSCAVREELHAQGRSVAEVASELGTTREQLTRKLAGQRVLQLRECLGLAFLLGIQVLPDPSSSADLLPRQAPTSESDAS